MTRDSTSGQQFWKRVREYLTVHLPENTLLQCAHR